MKEIDKLIQLLLSDDKSNWVLCYELCKANRISFKSVISKIFHNMKYWKEYDNIPYLILCNLEMDICFDNFEKFAIGGIWVEDNHIVRKPEFKSENEIINYTTKLIRENIKSTWC